MTNTNTLKSLRKITMVYISGSWTLRCKKDGKVHEYIGKRPIDVLEQAASEK